MNYAVILSGGKGSRMNVDYPKCAYPLLNKPMVEYLVDTLSKLDLVIICVVGYKSNIIVDLLKDRVKYAYQEEQLGSCDALKCARSHIVCDGYVLVINGDTPLVDNIIINSLINSHISNGNDITILTTIVDDPFGFGRIVRDCNNSIIKIVEESNATKSEKEIKEVNTGVYIINNNLLSMLDMVKKNSLTNEYYLTDLVSVLKNKVKIGSYNVLDNYKIRGINNLYQLSIVENEFKNDINKKHMLNGVKIINSSSVIISSDVKIASGSIIYPNTCIYGNTIIGKNSIIGPNTFIEDSIILDNNKIIYSYISNSKIGINNEIGPFSHIKMYSIIGDNNRIGNYVEIKNSIIKNNNKMAHLTYIGDAECHNNVNFGCGSIIANYDGKNKYKTIIGNDVFIGCNSNLIAPISIGDNCFIAAGSTVTKNLDCDEFVIARAKEVIKHNYESKRKNLQE